MAFGKKLFSKRQIVDLTVNKDANKIIKKNRAIRKKLRKQSNIKKVKVK